MPGEVAKRDSLRNLNAAAERCFGNISKRFARGDVRLRPFSERLGGQELNMVEMLSHNRRLAGCELNQELANDEQ